MSAKLAKYDRLYEQIKGYVQTVSYTHLDVYKRQEREHQCHGVFGHGIGRIGRYPDYRDAVLGGGFQIDIVETRAAPVSYTHLDVYKRQM